MDGNASKFGQLSIYPRRKTNPISCTFAGVVPKILSQGPKMGKNHVHFDLRSTIVEISQKNRNAYS